MQCTTLRNEKLPISPWRLDFARRFDPFFTTKPVGKGTGLDLSICYGIIKKMGGDIIVRSTMEVGTSFRVKIPIPKDEGQTGN